jgi:predicted transcriptional regulator
MSPAVRVQDCMRPGDLAVAWDDSADAAFARMRGAGLDAIPVISEYGVIGLLERSAAHACREVGMRSVSVPVANLMRRGAFVCRASDTVEQARAAMDRLEVDLLAVIDGAGRVVGVIGCDQDDVTWRCLVPAFYSSY